MSATDVYRLSDARGVLLYVGCSYSVKARLQSHARTQDWWPEVAYLEVETYPNRDRALAAEREAIWLEEPKFNGRGNLPPLASVPRSWSAGDAARYLGVTAETIRHWVQAGHIEAQRSPGRQYRFRVEDLDALVGSAA